jgi:HlyD family secretion protein
MNALKNKKTWTWGITVVVIAALTFVGLGFISSKDANAASAAEAQVVALNLAETIEASGSLNAQPSASLSWKTTGTVETVNVQTGDKVKEGDVLMTLDVTSAPASIISAQADLVTAQKNLEDLLNSDTGLAQAAIDLKDARESYDDAENYLRYLQTDNKVPQTIYSAELVQTHNGWRYEYTTDNFKGPAPEIWIVEAENDLALNKAQYEDAQREYDRLLAGETSSDVIAAQAKVDAAQATVNSLNIIAPFDGEVLYVSSRAGDVVGTTSLAVNVADMDHLYVETQVDESDIANVKLGDQVQVTLDAVPGVTLSGKVSAINPVGEVVSGLVKYTVRIDLDKAAGDVFLPLGATANVSISVGETAAVLAVPIVAIQNDSAGEYVWVVQADGSTERVNVSGGAIVDDLVVVAGDLREGDRVQLVRESSFQAPNPFGGGN